MVGQINHHLYRKRGFYYFSRRVPKDVQPLHGKPGIVLALNTRSRAKALKYSQVICQRLDERRLPMRLGAMGPGNVLVDDVKQQTASLLSEAVAHYLQPKGIGKAKIFHRAAFGNAGVVMDTARRIAAKSTDSVAFGKPAFYQQVERSLADAYGHAAAVMVENMLANDAEEGIAVFIEKCAPSWTDS